MKQKNEKSEIELKANCPCCYSGTYLKIESNIQSKIRLECEDCGFPLCEVTQYTKTLSECYVCSYSIFGKVFSFNPFSATKFECYLCEAEYSNIIVETIHGNCDDKLEKEAKESVEALALLKRVEDYSN